MMDFSGTAVTTSFAKIAVARPEQKASTRPSWMFVLPAP